MKSQAEQQSSSLTSAGAQLTSIEVASADLQFRNVVLGDVTPTGAQIAAAAGFLPAQQVSVLRWLDNHELEDIRPSEIIDLIAGSHRFIVVEADRAFRLTLDGLRIDWPAAVISGAMLRKLGAVAADKSIYYERFDQPDRLVRDEDVIDLRGLGVEAFHTRVLTWALNVQGVRLELPTPTVIVRDALVRAGFDVNQEWHIFLKVAGQAKQAVELDTVIDLRTPGIEKLRLVPKDVTNGEPPQKARRDFALLEVDEAFLSRRYAHWETHIDAGRRWLLIYCYPLPAGYNEGAVTLALEIAESYPGAQIDMFYMNPASGLDSGGPLPNTEARVDIAGASYQRWSRHRGPGSEWQPDRDNVITHLALVESSLRKEVTP
jgi:hypothetical protein